MLLVPASWWPLKGIVLGFFEVKPRREQGVYQKHWPQEGRFPSLFPVCGAGCKSQLTAPSALGLHALGKVLALVPSGKSMDIFHTAAGSLLTALYCLAHPSLIPLSQHFAAFLFQVHSKLKYFLAARGNFLPRC